MASQTLAQAGLFVNDEIVSGVVETIVSVNPIYAVLPFTPYDGQAIIVNKEVTLGTSEVKAVDTTITATAAATFTQATFTATRLVGQVDLDNLVQAQSTGGGVDQLAIEVASKAKSIARLFQTGMATGTGTSPQMNSLHSLCASTQYTTATGGTTSQALSFALLDELLDLVKSRDGEVDWMMMAARTMRSYKILLRALGGVAMDEVITLPDGRKVIGYETIPIFKNEYLSVAETADGAALTGGAMASVWAGNFDDGSGRVGISGIHPSSVPAGIQIVPVGQMETKDSTMLRLVQYTNFVNFSDLGLARLTSISN